MLSMEVLERNDLSYYRAVKDGCVYEIVASSVVDAFADFCSLAQSAANASTQVARPETELQICCKMLAFFKNKVGDDPVPYQDIAPAILRSKPQRPECIPHLYSFMIRCGGGKSAHLFTTTESFVKAHGHSGRALGVQAWDNLALDVRQKGMEQCVLWRHALLKAMYCHQEGLITHSDVRKSLSHKETFAKATQFEILLKELKRFGDSLSDLSPHQRLIGLGIFEVESVIVVLNKKPKDVVQPFQTCKDMTEAAFNCVQFWRQFSEDHAPSPWDSAAMTTATAASSTTSKEKIRDYTADGQLTSNAIVLDAGFEKGMMIVRKSDSMQAQIKDIGQKVVVVTDMSDGRDYNLDVDKLIGGEWKEQAKEKVKEPVKDPDAWKDLMNTAVIKASVIQRLHDALKQRPDQNKDLDMFQKPKGVTATADIAKNKCVLIPLTSKVDVVKQAEAKEPSAVAIKLDVEKHDGQDFNVCLQPPGVCVPFWMMKVTSEQEDSNMVLVKSGKILVARNPDKIDAGDDLVLFRPETAKKAPEPLQLSSGKPAKRQRTKAPTA
ncbi:unnamed protein product [Durusdinium trenchii]|uniref:Uncharacterized protein n=1 Tax=Durusdinium trenchii TaxID=1381693 RepID=A0ABP0Q7I8_9DINO